MSPEPENDQAEPTVIYDAQAQQRYEFSVTENGEVYETAHIYAPLPDERFVAFLRSIKARGDDKCVEDSQLEANTALWNDLVSEVENIEKDGVEDWKSLIEYSEKRDSLADFLAVAIVEPEARASGKRQLAKVRTETVITEAYFNSKPVQQTHTLKKKSDEWQKKYDRIQAKRLKPETTRGLRRQPKMEWVPQDEAIGRLYDEMFVESAGFKGGVIPLRFKTTVIHNLFGSKLDEKK